MPKKYGETHMQLSRWYEAIYPRRIDIVGDFGGKQLFLIDGDSLLLYSITTSKVDFEVGFQLLHAIFAVESFLKNLRLRGCNFQVAFFDNQSELCAPLAAPASVRSKYRMTRAILIQHLSRCANGINSDVGTGFIFSFPSIASDDFYSHLAQNPAIFLLCHDGHDTSGHHSPHQAPFQYMIHEFLRLGHSVALIHSTEFKSSRVIVSMITAAGKIPSLKPSPSFWPTPNVRKSRAPSPLDWAVYRGSSYRELWMAVALSRILQKPRGERYDVMATAMILHAVIVGNTRLVERSLTLAGLKESGIANAPVRTFIDDFCQEVTSLIASDLGNPLPREMNWDAFDLIDGRLFLLVHAFLSQGKPLPVALIDKAEPLVTCVEQWSGFSLRDCISLKTSTNREVEGLQGMPVVSSTDSIHASILIFNHEILKEFLAPVQLQTTQLHEEVHEAKIFRELTHWHNAKVPIDPKRLQKRPGHFAMKRTQRFMRDTLVYSASLTNATGKLIEPETIVVSPTPLLKKTLPNYTAAGSTKVVPKRGETRKKTRAGAGKSSAQEAARLTQARKLKERNTAALRKWQTDSRELSQEPVFVKRFKKTMKLLLNLSKEDTTMVGAEVSLYLCDTLYRAWEEQFVATNYEQALSIGSLLFNQVMQTMKMPGVTKEIVAVLRVLAPTIDLPSEDLPDSPDGEMISRPLSFEPRVTQSERQPLPPLGDREFQLRHCGPFLDRTLDSREDHRVPFQPDAWQRSVLDSLDANDSLFIVAPTSSGKTFISFYAMKQILQADDDGVLVYVAPTKALVNQIAAEVQARFQKNLRHEGRSVWAIHTRDYRINNPTGCQILVTVPHVLQIMLLAPSNATGNNAWSKRVRRIIFDEVHCIGQADDGIIWEQLLLMAPCPIIALSATVGNPEEFYEWLKISQTSKGFQLKMITHSTRYSDLRAFQYVPPKCFVFKGLASVDKFPVPGLGLPNNTNSNFRFIHPIATLVHRVGIDLDDISLEPRDTLTLWDCMNRFQTESFPLDESLDPSRVFSGIPKKSDVYAWTQRLKAVLATWIQDTASPFDEVRDGLDGDTQANHDYNGAQKGDERDPKKKMMSVFALLCDLKKEDGLPAILFDYDRLECERALVTVLKQLLLAEREWKESSKDWQKKIKDYELWKASENKRQAAKKPPGKLTKEERVREEASADISKWESFDPQKPLQKFSFADESRLGQSELEEIIRSLAGEHIQPQLFSALKRGVAVHHAGMNRRYRQVVEILFRKGYLTAVIATGTLALGINMPCRTVAFIGDSAFLTTLNYRQASGRAGRRGFDLLGNVVFCNIGRARACELMSSRLPDLKGHFPLSTTLVLRILALSDATGQSSFASGVLKSLLTQSRLYLGGAEAGMAIQHHLRFSIEYLQRQHLLSANGEPLNFAGLVGHLYFTENAVFALHSLLKGGYFHRLCSNIRRNPTEVLRNLVLVMAHLFNRIQKRPDSHPWAPEKAQASPGQYQLPRLPHDAEYLLIRHNKETLQTFKAYASTFIDQYLDGTPDRHLPLTGIAVGGEDARILHLPGARPPTKLRSPFSALSGHSDDFESIHELCSNVRSGVFLDESAVPYIPIWPHDLTVPLNSYLYDFFKHGDYVALTRDNKIKQGDVWFLLKDFSLILATVIASLTNFIRHDGSIDDAEMIDLDNEIEALEENGMAQVVDPSPEGDKKLANARSKPAKKKVADSWDDEDTDGEDDATSSEESDYVALTTHWPIREEDGEGLVNVLKAFTLLKQEFEEKFHKAWA